MTGGALVLMGSGENAPGMTKVHRALLHRLSRVDAVNLDTTYGFQENVAQVTGKLVSYFEKSLHVELTPLSFTNYEESSPLERTMVKQRVRDATYVFAGPGSPSYALSQWQPLDIVDDFSAVLEAGGTLCFSSAAVVTLGAYTAPIYEIYKAGAAPYWLPGLNLLSRVGLNCVAIPHFDNAEGANYDTSRCYLGERRLSLMERDLPDDVATLGVDEHTALVIDLATDTIEVLGKSNGYWRHHGHTRVLANGSQTALDELRTKHVPPLISPVTEPRPSNSAVTDPSELGHLASGDGPVALEAIARLIDLATSGTRTTVDVAALIDGVLLARSAARSRGEYEFADQLRDLLTKSGVEIHDEPSGSTWTTAN
ncbi:MAG: type 1 glutamine amidotransferase family protein [Acidimicrobiales bacterium]